MTSSVQWGGTWEHPACGKSGDTLWEDEDTARSGHDCGRDGEITWQAEWHCHDCGESGGVETFDDDTTAYSGHECDDDLEEVAA